MAVAVENKAGAAASAFFPGDADGDNRMARVLVNLGEYVVGVGDDADGLDAGPGQGAERQHGNQQRGCRWK